MRNDTIHHRCHNLSFKPSRQLSCRDSTSESHRPSHSAWQHHSPSSIVVWALLEEALLCYLVSFLMRPLYSSLTSYSRRWSMQIRGFTRWSYFTVIEAIPSKPFMSLRIALCSRRRRNLRRSFIWVFST